MGGAPETPGRGGFAPKQALSFFGGDDLIKETDVRVPRSFLSFR